MAWATARACSVPGCPELVTKPGVYRCDKHQREYLDQWNRPRDIKYTGKMWRRHSRIFLSQHPVCERCGAPSELTHHIIRKREGGSDDFDNLEALCRACHEREHSKKGERWGASAR